MSIKTIIRFGWRWEVKALLALRHEAPNVLERVVGFSFFQWHTTFHVWCRSIPKGAMHYTYC